MPCFSFVTLLPRCCLRTYLIALPGKKILLFSKVCWLFSMNFSESDKSGILLRQWTIRYPVKCCYTENCPVPAVQAKWGNIHICHNGVMLFPLLKTKGFFQSIGFSNLLVTVFLQKNFQFSCLLVFFLCCKQWCSIKYPTMIMSCT